MSLQQKPSRALHRFNPPIWRLVELSYPIHDCDVLVTSFMHCDLGYFDLEQKTLQPLDNPFGTRLSPTS